MFPHFITIMMAMHIDKANTITEPTTAAVANYYLTFTRLSAAELSILCENFIVFPEDHDFRELFLLTCHHANLDRICTSPPSLPPVATSYLISILRDGRGWVR